MRSRFVLAALLSCSSLLSACSTGNDAVAVGGTFQFVSPGGQTEIRYDPPSSRGTISDLSGPSVRDDSVTVSLADYAGEIVVINLWGQWCAPCRSEVDDLQRIHQQAGVNVLGINLRDPRREKPADFLNDNGVTFASIWDPSQVAVSALKGFPTSVVPSTLVLDTRHRVAAVFLAEVTDEQVLAEIERISQQGEQ